MNIQLGDTLILKKNHPCAKNANAFLVLRIGMDIRIKCLQCGHEMLLPRSKVERSIQKIIKQEQ